MEHVTGLQALCCSINLAGVDSYTPFTRYNRLSNRFDNRFDNQFDNRLYRVFNRLSSRFENRLYRVNGALAFLQCTYGIFEFDSSGALCMQYKIKLECGPMPNVMAALPNIGGALC